MADEKLIEPNKDSVTYSSYLKVDQLLNLQHTLSKPEEHDETLFIIIHQVYELWFKQILHELGQLELLIKNDNLMPFIKTISRINTILTTLTNQVDILETMTPIDFNRFRGRLNPASGFQSYQFRLVEFKMGVRDKAYLKFYKAHKSAQTILENELQKKSIYDEFLAYVDRRGFKIPEAILNRDVSLTYQPSDEVVKVFVEAYNKYKEYYDLYLAAEALIELDQKFLLWRYRHVAMVERMIGNRMGTGGSSGTKYLSATLSKRFFPELWSVRNELGPTYGMQQELPLKDKQ